VPNVEGKKAGGGGRKSPGNEPQGGGEALVPESDRRGGGFNAGLLTYLNNNHLRRRKRKRRRIGKNTIPKKGYQATKNNPSEWKLETSRGPAVANWTEHALKGRSAGKGHGGQGEGKKSWRPG